MSFLFSRKICALPAVVNAITVRIVASELQVTSTVRAKKCLPFSGFRCQKNARKSLAFFPPGKRLPCDGRGQVEDI